MLKQLRLKPDYSDKKISKSHLHVQLQKISDYCFLLLLYFRTIICRKTGSKQQSVKAIDVKIETDPFVNDQYDAFCVKDEGQH